MAYFLHVAALLGIYAILALSLNLLAGFAGMTSIAHGAFFGLGAYAAAVLWRDHGLGVEVGVVAAVCVSALASWFMGLACTRVREEYFVIATFSFHVVVYTLLLNAISLTGGPFGLSGIRSTNLVAREIERPLLLFLILAGCLAAIWFSGVFARSRFGRVLLALKEDEVHVATLGLSVPAFKLAALVAAGAWAGLAGALFSYQLNYVHPSSFTVNESILLIAAVIAGGAGSVRGPLIGVVIFIMMPEMLRFAGASTVLAANLRQLVYGLVLVAVILWRPQGLMGRFEPGLRERKA